MHASNVAGDPTPLVDNATLAIAAIHEGLSSAAGSAWETYMKQFVNNNDPNQLARLLATDGTLNDRNARMRRAYLIGNGVCGTTTDTGLDHYVFTIDENIPGGDGCGPNPNAKTKVRISIQGLDE